VDKKVELSQTSKKIKKLIKPKLAKRLGGNQVGRDLTNSYAADVCAICRLDL